MATRRKKTKRLIAHQFQYVSSTAMASELLPLRTALLERSSCEFYKISTHTVFILTFFDHKEIGEVGKPAEGLVI